MIQSQSKQILKISNKLNKQGPYQFRYGLNALLGRFYIPRTMYLKILSSFGSVYTDILSRGQNHTITVFRADCKV